MNELEFSFIHFESQPTMNVQLTVSLMGVKAMATDRVTLEDQHDKLWIHSYGEDFIADIDW